jgi:hypothetical protein
VLVKEGARGLSERTDNMVNVFNMQRQGASQFLLYETRQIFSLLQRMDMRLLVTHTPGVENEVADALSRLDKVGDYSLKQEYFRRGVEAWVWSRRWTCSPTARTTSVSGSWHFQVGSRKAPWR